MQKILMFQKLQLNTFHSLLLIGFLLLGSRSFAQDGLEPSNITTITPSSKSDSAAAEGEVHDTKELETLLKKYNTDSKKVLEDNSKMRGSEDESEVTDADIEEMRTTVPALGSKKGKSRQEKAAMISPGFSTSVRFALEPMQKMSEPELLKRLDEATKTSVLRPYMDQIPNLTIFTVRLIKDKESIPSLAKIVEDKDRLVHFVGALLCTVIFGFILKRLLRSDKRSFLEAAAFFFLRMIIMSAIRIGLIYWFFSAELAPAIKVFNLTFL